MRALTLILIVALAGLWAYYGVAIAPADTRRPVAVEDDGKALSAATLNNEGVQLDRRGRHGDALAYFERASDFRPRDPVIRANRERAKARVQKRGWLTALVGSSAAAGFFIVVGGLWSFTRGAVDGARLARLKLRGDPWVRIQPNEKTAELPLRFSEDVDRLLRRHPLTIVWSSARHGKHMKSRPPVKTDGRACTVRLNRDRIERLRRYPGDWKGFLYVGKTPVGETAARVG